MSHTDRRIWMIGVGPAVPELDARSIGNGLVYLGLDDNALELVLAGLDTLDTDPGPTAEPGTLQAVADVQALAAWIRYQQARFRRDQLRNDNATAIPTESAADPAGGS